MSAALAAVRTRDDTVAPPPSGERLGLGAPHVPPVVWPVGGLEVGAAATTSPVAGYAQLDEVHRGGGPEPADHGSAPDFSEALAQVRALARTGTGVIEPVGRGDVRRRGLVRGDAADGGARRPHRAVRARSARRAVELEWRFGESAYSNLYTCRLHRSTGLEAEKKLAHRAPEVQD